MYIIDTGVPINNDQYDLTDWNDATDTLDGWAEDLGIESVSSGTGFGFRDQQYETKDRKKALEFERRFKEKYGNIKVGDEEAYCGIGHYTWFQSKLDYFEFLTLEHNLRKLNKVLNYVIGKVL